MGEQEYTPEQQAAIDAWLTEGFEPPTMTAEEAHAEDVYYVVHSFVDHIHGLIHSLDDLDALYVSGADDRRDLREVLSGMLETYEGRDDDRSLEDLS